MSLHITLLGTDPVPQGSKSAFVNPKTGRAILTDANKKTKPWRELLAQHALRSMELQGVVKTPHGTPVGITIDFFFTRPASHYGTGKNAGVVKPMSPRWKATKPDIDKLERAVFDALTGVAFHDDSQVVETFSRKVYSETAGVHIVCYTL